MIILIVCLLVAVVGVGFVAALISSGDSSGPSAEDRALRDSSRCPAPTREGVGVRVVNGDPRDWCLYLDLDSMMVVDTGEVVFAAPVE